MSIQAFFLAGAAKEVGSWLKGMVRFLGVGASTAGRHDAELAVGVGAQLSDEARLGACGVIGRVEPDVCASFHSHLRRNTRALGKCLVHCSGRSRDEEGGSRRRQKKERKAEHEEEEDENHDDDDEEEVDDDQHDVK